MEEWASFRLGLLASPTTKITFNEEECAKGSGEGDYYHFVGITPRRKSAVL